MFEGVARISFWIPVTRSGPDFAWTCWCRLLWGQLHGSLRGGIFFWPFGRAEALMMAKGMLLGSSRAIYPCRHLFHVEHFSYSPRGSKKNAGGAEQSVS